MKEVITANLSDEMKAALEYIKEHGGTIKRYPGGFWQSLEWLNRERRFFGTTTIEALVKRGKLEYSEWKPGWGTSKFPIEAKVREAA